MGLTQKRLHERLSYNPLTGKFKKVSNYVGPGKPGDIVGTLDKKGYRIIGVDGKIYKAHRLAWLYMTGYFPEYEVDHDNRIKDDNRWKNLKHVTSQCNKRNVPRRSDNTSGITGVSYDHRSEKWRSYITIDSKFIGLGYFTTIEGAVKARWDAEVQYDWSNCSSISLAYKYLKDKGII